MTSFHGQSIHTLPPVAITYASPTEAERFVEDDSARYGGDVYRYGAEVTTPNGFPATWGVNAVVPCGAPESVARREAERRLAADVATWTLREVGALTHLATHAR